MEPWPATVEELMELQESLARLAPPRWSLPADGPPAIAGCFVAFPRGEHGAGAAGDRAVAAAALVRGAEVLARATVEGAAGGPYRAGLLALREGPLLAAAVRALGASVDVLLVDGTGRDHPRGAGLALQLGWSLDVPSIGVTHRPLCAEGGWPPARRGARSALLLDGVHVGWWLRVRAGVRPLAVHAGWRTDADTAAELVLGCTRVRTPEPLREARRLARTARATWREPPRRGRAGGRV